jgi:hypothetical protein
MSPVSRAFLRLYGGALVAVILALAITLPLRMGPLAAAIIAVILGGVWVFPNARRVQAAVREEKRRKGNRDGES